MKYKVVHSLETKAHKEHGKWELCIFCLEERRLRGSMVGSDCCHQLCEQLVHIGAGLFSVAPKHRTLGFKLQEWRF